MSHLHILFFLAQTFCTKCFLVCNYSLHVPCVSYGCCQDGVTDAQGPNKEGCVEYVAPATTVSKNTWQSVYGRQWGTITDQIDHKKQNVYLCEVFLCPEREQLSETLVENACIFIWEFCVDMNNFCMLILIFVRSTTDKPQRVPAYQLNLNTQQL